MSTLQNPILRTPHQKKTWLVGFQQQLPHIQLRKKAAKKGIINSSPLHKTPLNKNLAS